MKFTTSSVTYSTEGHYYKAIVFIWHFSSFVMELYSNCHAAIVNLAELCALSLKQALVYFKVASI